MADGGDEITVMASRFKAECLALLDRVERSRISVVITKRGRPVARLAPLPAEPERRGTEGSVRLLAAEDAAYYGTSEEWDAEPRG